MDFLDFLFQPIVEVPVPFNMGRPLLAASGICPQTLGVLPYFSTGRAPSPSVEGMPSMATGAAPFVRRAGLPFAFWAGYFDFGHVIGWKLKGLEQWAAAVKNEKFISPKKETAINRKTGLRYAWYPRAGQNGTKRKAKISFRPNAPFAAYKWL